MKLVRRLLLPPLLPVCVCVSRLTACHTRAHTRGCRGAAAVCMCESAERVRLQMRAARFDCEDRGRGREAGAATPRNPSHTREEDGGSRRERMEGARIARGEYSERSQAK